jgi:adenylate cyclase
MQNNDQSLSVLCTDIRGAAIARPPGFLGLPGLPELPDESEARYAIGRCESRIRRSVETYGGRLVNRNGGNLMAFFSDNTDALQSAIEMKRRIADLPPYSGLPLTIHVGVCAGHQAKEMPYFPEDGSNAAATLAAVADPEHILLSIPKRVTSLPGLPPHSDSVPDLAIKCGNRRLGVFRVGWQEHRPAVPRAPIVPAAASGNAFDRLVLRHDGREIVLDGNRTTLTIGRHPDCALKLQNIRSSRLHGTIERRLDRFVFIDRSSNGTFVTLEDQIEFFVHRKELMLFGHGQLSLGQPSSTEGAEVLQFQTGSFP